MRVPVVRNPVPDMMDEVDAHPCEGTRRTMLADGTSAMIAITCREHAVPAFYPDYKGYNVVGCGSADLRLRMGYVKLVECCPCTRGTCLLAPFKLARATVQNSSSIVVFLDTV